MSETPPGRADETTSARPADAATVTGAGAPSTTAVVLAGGGSERFGDQPKATATLAGRPLVGRVVAALGAATDAPPVVAVGDRAKQGTVEPVVPAPVRYRYDVAWCDGPVAGVAGALPVVDTDAVVLCGCDMPLVRPAVVRWLARLLDGAADAVVPVVDGVEQPLHAVYDRAALRAYCRRRPTEDRLTGLLASLRVRTVAPSEAPAGVPLRRSVTNVNTRDELAVLERAAD
jgi:molybdopterin-guanine dinucleotide biosynthesis protein A